MKKLLISSCISSALLLSACGGDTTMSDIQTATPTVSPASRVVFDPSNGKLNIPNDLLIDQVNFDYTLAIPVADRSDFGDPSNALNVLDGWSTTQPFVIDVTTPTGVSLDASTLAAGVHLVKTEFTSAALPDGINATCFAGAVLPGSCDASDVLTYGVDYVLQLADEDTIAVIPLKPLESFQGYMVVVTDALKDSAGNGVKGSTTWELVKADINTAPLSSDAQLGLQTIVNGYVATLAQVGFTRDELSYVGAFNTQSTTDVTETMKKLLVATYAARFAAGDPAAATSLPSIIANDPAPGVPTNAMEALGLVSADTVTGAIRLAAATAGLNTSQTDGILAAVDFSPLQTCAGLLNAAANGETVATTGITDVPTLTTLGTANQLATGVAPQILAQAGAFCAASHYQGTVALPYYLATPSSANPMAPVNEFMTSACDSGIVLALAPQDALAALAANPGPNDAMCQAVGLRDLGVDSQRFLTAFSPVPAMQGSLAGFENLNVQMTVPNAAVATALGYPLTKPATGWPVVILYHGITSKKEDMLAITGALSLAGYATVAIDQPLHGSRGFDLTGDGVDEINATTVSATHYMNLASLPTARDNLRQSVADLLGVRVALHALQDGSSGSMVDLDANNVSVMGVSLGAMTGGNFAAIANKTMGGSLAALDAMFTVKAAALESPGGGVANFLLESQAFSPLIKALLASEASTDFQQYLVATETDTSNEAALAGAFATFYGSLTAAQQAVFDGVFAEFTFAAGSVLDAADPMNYASLLGSNTPVLGLTVVGDGTPENPSDTVIPAITSNGLYGQIPLWRNVGASQVVDTTSGDPLQAYILYSAGAHGSSLNPAPNAAVTTEMQMQIASFIASMGTAVVVNDTTYVLAN